jgi:hypothetical protein
VDPSGFCVTCSGLERDRETAFQILEWVVVVVGGGGHLSVALSSFAYRDRCALSDHKCCTYGSDYFAFLFLITYHVK